MALKIYAKRMADWQRRLPPLTALIPFEAAFRHRNFTKAAEELHYSQATISRRVAALEADLGVKLFERGRHDVQPTADAESLAAAVAMAFAELAGTAERTRRKSSQRDTLTIHSDLSLSTTLITSVVGDFQRRHPELVIRVLSSFEPIEKTQERFDIGIQYGRDTDSALTADPIADDNVFPVCSPDVAARLPSPLSAARLAALPLLHVDYGEPSWTDWHQFLDHVGADSSPAGEGLTFTSYLVCLDMAERDEGLALGWERTVQPRLDTGRLVRLPGFTMARPDAICAYRPPWPANPSAHVDEFLAVLRERLPPLS